MVTRVLVLISCCWAVARAQPLGQNSRLAQQPPRSWLRAAQRAIFGAQHISPQGKKCDARLFFPGGEYRLWSTCFLNRLTSRQNKGFRPFFWFVVLEKHFSLFTAGFYYFWGTSFRLQSPEKTRWAPFGFRYSPWFLLRHVPVFAVCYVNKTTIDASLHSFAVFLYFDFAFRRRRRRFFLGEAPLKTCTMIHTIQKLHSSPRHPKASWYTSLRGSGGV